MRTIPLMIILIVNWTLVSLANKWGLEWWKVGSIYLLAVIAVLFSPFLRRRASRTESPEQKVSEALEEVEEEIKDALSTKPISADEVIIYLRDCINYFKNKGQ